MERSRGTTFPDPALPDHAGNRRKLSDLVAGDPAVLHCHPRLFSAARLLTAHPTCGQPHWIAPVDAI
jgi:hypothetical protein